MKRSFKLYNTEKKAEKLKAEKGWITADKEKNIFFFFSLWAKCLPFSHTLYLNEIFLLNSTSDKLTLHLCRTISLVKQDFFPLDKSIKSTKGGKKHKKLMPTAHTSCFWCSVFPPSAPRAARWWLVWHVFCRYSFALNCFGVWCFIPTKGWAAAVCLFCCCI